MFDYDARLGAVVTAAWDTWTKNGLNLDEIECELTGDTVREAAISSYFTGISNSEWLAATLVRLEHLSPKHLPTD
jgi:hypothetical protein